MQETFSVVGVFPDIGTDSYALHYMKVQVILLCQVNFVRFELPWLSIAEGPLRYNVALAHSFGDHTDLLRYYVYLP